VDHGRDFYASTSFSDLPEGDRRRIWMGWLSNWEYAKVRTVISDRVFPRPTNRGVALFAEGGTAELVSLRAWPLEAAVRR